MTEPTKISVKFERKLDLGNYQNVTASAWVEAETDGSHADVADKLGDAFGLAKAAVLDELGIEVLLDESGTIREKYAPSVTKQDTGERAVRRELGGTGGFDTLGVNVTNAKDMTEDVPSWLPGVMETHGIVSVWANQGKFGPFYKEKVTAGEDPAGPWEWAKDKDGQPVKRTSILKENM